MAFVACPLGQEPMAFTVCPPPGLDMPEELVLPATSMMDPQQGAVMQAWHMYSMATLVDTQKEMRECLQSHVETTKRLKDELLNLRSALPRRTPAPTDNVAGHRCWAKLRSTPVVWLPAPSPVASDENTEAVAEAAGEGCADGCVAESDVQSTVSGGSHSDQSPRSSSDRTPMSEDSGFSRGTSPEEASGGEVNLAKIFDGREKRTTCLIRNLPSRLTQYGLLQAIEVATCGQVTASSVERIKLPVCRNGKGIGFAFLQFRQPTDVATFAMAFHGYCWPTLYSYKMSEVLYAKTQSFPDDFH